MIPLLLFLKIDELGRTVGNICTITPGGVVCFFPSYDYEHKVLSRWEETGQLQKIAKKKQVRGSSIGSSSCMYVACVGI